MTKSWDEIVTAITHRRTIRGPLLESMMQVRERYNGDWVLPDLGTSTQPLTPTIIADAIDHNGLRAASVMPDINTPALSATTTSSQKRAANRRKALLYTWEKSKLNLHLRRSYRHMFGYATTALVVMPDFTHDCVTIQVRDPLNCFPEPKAAEDLSPPGDCGFIYGRSAEWLLHNYPEQSRNAGVEKSRSVNGGTALWDVVEWIDEDEVVMGVLGPRDLGYYDTISRPFELRRWPNRVGRCTVVTPQRVTLDKVASAVANATGIADFQARLMHLNMVALEKAIVPDTYIVGKSTSPPRLVGGGWKDGRTGEVNEILDADSIGQLRNTPDQTALMMVERLEATARQNTGTANPFLGQGTGGARTGRGIDALMAAAVDPRIQEAQEIVQSALTEVNEIVGHAYLGYFGDKKYTVFSGWVTDNELSTFEPKADFGETVANKAFYAMPGTDIVGLNVVLGQLVGTEALSLETMRKLHPFIKDADGEQRRVLVQKLRQAAEMQILTRASDPAGGWTPIDMANLIKFVEQGTDLAAAIEKADQEARRRQAAAAPPPTPEQPVAPEMMDGLANPGEGAAGQPPIGPPPAGLANLDSLLGALAAPVGPRP